MKLTILKKILLLTGSIIICIVTGLVAAAGLLITKGFDEQMAARIETMSRTAKYVLNQRLTVADDHLARFAASDDALAATLSRDDTQLKRMAEQSIARDGLDALIVLDSKDRLLTRVTSKEASGFAIQNKIEGAGSGIHKLSDGALYYVKVLPLTLGGERIGTLQAGVRFDGNMALVDEIKELTGCEATIFNGATRVATTLVKDGKRVVGTTMDNPAIIERVLQQSLPFETDNVIFEDPFATGYYPLKDFDGKVVGMMFVGLSKISAIQSLRSILITLVGIGLATGFGFIVLAAYLSRRITRPIVKATLFAKSLSNGDLEQTIETRSTDEAGSLISSLKIMASNLRATINEAQQKSIECLAEADKAKMASREADVARQRALASRSEGILEAAERIDGIARHLGGIAESISRQVDESFNGANTQRDRMLNMAAAMEELNATIGEVAKNASASAQASHEARNQAQNGAAMVLELTNEIITVRERSSELQESMQSLDRVVASIGTIVGVISDIADQTNLLALNAAIEAARAGESGRGFAVVADEVRKLAEKTMAATREVGVSISEIQINTRDNSENVIRTYSAVERVSGLAVSSGEALQSIVKMAEQASDEAQSIAAASQQQSAASEEINRVIEDVNTISGDTAMSMTHTSASVSALVDQTHNLLSLVESMQIQESSPDIASYKIRDVPFFKTGSRDAIQASTM